MPAPTRRKQRVAPNIEFHATFGWRARHNRRYSAYYMSAQEASNALQQMREEHEQAVATRKKVMREATTSKDGVHRRARPGAWKWQEALLYSRALPNGSLIWGVPSARKVRGGQRDGQNFQCADGMLAQSCKTYFRFDNRAAAVAFRDANRVHGRKAHARMHPSAGRVMVGGEMTVQALLSQETELTDYLSSFADGITVGGFFESEFSPAAASSSKAESEYGE